MATLTKADKAMLLRQLAIKCVKYNEARAEALRKEHEFGLFSAEGVIARRKCEYVRGEADGMRYLLARLGVTYEEEWDDDGNCVAIWQLGRQAKVNILQDVMLEVA